MFPKIRKFIINNKYEFFLAFFIAIYIAYFTTASFLRHDNFYTGRFDLGNMDQTVWNTINGRIFQMTNPDNTENVSRLAYHADFILILLSPFYLIWQNPKMLLLIQTITVALGAVFIYLIAKRVLKNKNLSLTFSFSFLMNQSLQYANLYDFHAVTLATTFLLGAFYFLILKRYIYFLLFAILAALTKEQIWLIVALFGGYIVIRRKEIIFGIFLMIISLFIFRYLIWTAIPQARGGEHFAIEYYSQFGETPGNVIKNMIFSPTKTLGIILEKERVEYTKQIFLPAGFLPLISPFYLIFAAPDFLINLLSSNKQLHQIYYQYTAAITPFIFISSIFAVKTIKKRYKLIPYSFFSLYLILAVFYSAYSFGPLPGARKPNIDMLTKPLPKKETIHKFLSEIPRKTSVAATNNVGAHLSQREKIYTIPVGLKDADIIVFLLNDSFAQPSLNAQKEMAEKLKNDKTYVEIFREGDFVAFKKVK